MISVALARSLADSGLVWHPATGDAFIIDRPEADDDVYTISEMTIEAHSFGASTVLGFNGTTEWALDSVGLDEALWLPREHQLRALLAGTFRSLSREGDGFVVLAVLDGVDSEFRAEDAADAYGRALLALIELAEA